MAEKAVFSAVQGRVPRGRATRVRPIPIELPGAVHHVTSRGDRCEPIFDDEDRRSILAMVELASARFDAQVLACCLMRITSSSGCTHFGPISRG